MNLATAIYIDKKMRGRLMGSNFREATVTGSLLLKVTYFVSLVNLRSPLVSIKRDL